MRQPRSEGLHEKAIGLDVLPAIDVARRLYLAQMEALECVGDALDGLARGADLMAQTIRNGATIWYGAAGSSGLMASADAMELPGTFGLPADRIRILMAGGLPTSSEMLGDTEDNAEDAEAAAGDIASGDTVIVLSASGSTPYAVALARAARAVGAGTICIANNPDTPLLEHATVAICLPTPPEMIAGSTRMGAGTAQKVALNILSTLTGVELGHVHDGMMVNVRADNRKLRARAVGIVRRIADVPEERARSCLDATSNDVKSAVVLAAGAGSLTRAEELLVEHRGRLRHALDSISNRPARPQ